MVSHVWAGWLAYCYVYAIILREFALLKYVSKLCCIVYNCVIAEC